MIKIFPVDACHFGYIKKQQLVKESPGPFHTAFTELLAHSFSKP